MSSTFVDDVHVPARVESAAWVESRRGTKGIHINFDFMKPELNPFGNGQATIDMDIWISAGSANIAHKTLKTLGVDTDTVDEAKFRYEINELLKDAEASLVCSIEEANEYHPDDRWKVKFVNELGAADGGAVADPLAVLRGRKWAKKKNGKKAETPLLDGKDAKAPASWTAPTKPAGENEDDIPF